MYDLIIKNGLIADGTGQPAYYGDIAIEKNKIACVCKGGHIDAPAVRVIDAEGMIVCPGFIDGHSHSDLGNVTYPINKISQGITTEVVGNCGFSDYPFTARGREAVHTVLSSFIDPPYRDEDDERDFVRFISEKKEDGIMFNFASLVGFGILRAEVMGLAERPATEEEISKMCSILDHELQKGALGLSVGLIYLPQLFASTEELERLAAVVKKHDKILTAHVRGEGNTLLDAVDEIISVCEKSGCRLVISHLKAIGQANWGSLHLVLDKIENARKRGADIMADCYYYKCSATSVLSILPPWAISGSAEGVRQILKDPEKKGRIKEYLLPGGESTASELLQSIYIYNLKGVYKEYDGMVLQDIARAMGKDLPDTVFALVEKEDSILVLGDTQSEEDYKDCVVKDYVMTGSDANPHGPADKDFCNPRDYGAFPHFFNKYVHQEKLLSMEEAIHKMTGLTAACYRLKDRGLIREGYFADITIIDKDDFREGNSDANPAVLACGISYVIINGQIQVENGTHHQLPAGEILM